MKLAQINTTDFGSTGTIMLQTAALARENGIEVYTYSKKWRGEKRSIEGHSYIGSLFGNVLHRVFGPLTGNSELFSYFSTKKLVRSLKKKRITVLHLHNLHGWYLHLPTLFSYIKKENIKVIWTLHDCWSFTGHCPHFEVVKCEKWRTGCYACPQYKQYPETYLDCSKKAYKRKKQWFTGVKDLTVITPSKWLAELVQQSYLKNYKVKIVYNGIDLSVFKPTESNFREKHGLQEKKILLGVALDWGMRKGLDVFAKLAERLPSSYQIVLVGTNEEVEKELPKNVLCIRRTQNVRELAQIYTAADLFVNPTREEVLGLVNIEALACGTPVITFASGGSPECIDESCGLIVQKDDLDGLEKGILRIVEERPFTKENCIQRAKLFDKQEKYVEYIKAYMEK